MKESEYIKIKLSENQKGLFFEHQLNNDSTYNITTGIIINEFLNIQLFQKAFELVIKKHSALRTYFKIIDNEPYQIIKDKVEYKFNYKDISHLTEKEKKKYIKKISIRNSSIIFDLFKYPLFNAELIKANNEEYYFFIAIHHIISDGWSMEILKKDLVTYYFELKKNVNFDIDIPEHQFYKLVLNENEKLNSNEYDKYKKYWSDKMKGYEPFHFLTDFRNELDKPKEGKEIQFKINKSLYQKIKHLSLEFGVTPFMFLFAVFKVFLNKYTLENDITVTSPFTNRMSTKYQDVFGYFVNLLPIRDYIDPEEKFNEFLNKVKKTIIEAYKNVKYPNNLIFREINNKKGYLREIFDISFTFDVYEENELINKIKFKEYKLEKINLPGNLMFLFLDNMKELFCKIQYNSSVFSKKTIKNLAKNFINLLKQISDNPYVQIYKYNLISYSEKKVILEKFNNSFMKIDYLNETLIHKFEKKAEKFPEKIGLKYNDTILTYSEINKKANQLARFLISKNITKDSIVGIMTKRCPEMVIGILAILKTGAAYVPIDPEYPENRIKYIISDSKVKVVLSRKDDLKKVSKEITKIINIDLNNSFVYKGNDTNLNINIKGDDLAYIIYTSGSTGQPKGVMIEHKGITNILEGLERFFPLKNNDAYLLKTTFTFDVSVTELFGWFFGNGKLVILENGFEKDPYKILEVIENDKITHINFVPSMFKSLLRVLNSDESRLKLKNLKYIFVAGEAIPPVDVKEYYNLKLTPEFVNIYGPTEATIYGTLYYLKDFKNGINVPIGKPVPNYKCYIVDKYNNLVPIGVPGELCLTGPGIARGYKNKPELTKEKFTVNPFYQQGENEIYNKMYHTGDLVKWLPDGNIEYLGRIDYQVKIRGFRIELGEIENSLLKNDKISQAVVISKTDKNGDKFLCAYYKSDKKISDFELRNYLLEQIPSYMIPSHFIRVEKFPLTSSGKIDRKNLPEIKKYTRNINSELLPPETDTQKKIAYIYKDILNVDSIGIEDNFFDLGAHSLSLIQIGERLKQEFNVDFSIIKLFQYTNIKLLAEYIDSLIHNKKEGKDKQIEKFHPEKNNKKRENESDIAIIGMAGRFPGAKNINVFWENLKNGVESIKHFTDEELIKAGVDEEDLKQENYVRAKGVLEDIEYFDPEIFGYSPKEIEIMEPQLRVLYQCTYEALEDAGIVPDKHKGSIGFFAGCSDNLNWVTRLLFHDANMGDKYQAFTLTTNNFLATRISYKLNLKGPSLTVQTGCSTSLVSVHLACQSIIEGDCDIAVAGGVTIELPKISGYFYYKGMIFSPDGHCRPFDDKAMGTVFSDGVGLVVLKPLKKAIEDGDHIYAVIKSSSINNDGNSKVAYTAPSIEGQAEAIKKAYDKAGINPETITFIEAHGTGTSLGDPIEVESLKLAFNSEKKQFCWLTSVKGNIGHMDIAAGIGGLIKAALCIKNRKLPPVVNFEKPNSKINFIDSPFVVNKKLIELKGNFNNPIRAGINAFGVGGTNVHIVLEEPPEIERENDFDKWNLLVFSANTNTSLENYIKKISNYFINNNLDNVSDVAYTLQTGRKFYKYRKYILIKNDERNIRQLLLNNKNIYLVNNKKNNLVIYLHNLSDDEIKKAKNYYNKEKLFSNIVNKAFNDFQLEFQKEIKNCLEKGKKNNLLLSFVFQYSLLKFFDEIGIKTSIIIGEGIGDLVYAYFIKLISRKLLYEILIGKKNKHIPIFNIETLTLTKTEYPYYSIESKIFIKNEKILKIIDINKEIYNLLQLDDNEEYKNIDLLSFSDEYDKILTKLKFKNIFSIFKNNKNSISYILYKFIGKQWSSGIEVNFSLLHENRERKKLSLPTYVFDKHYFSIDTIDPEKLLSGNNEYIQNFASKQQNIIYEREKADDYVAPENEIEEKICKAFEKVLGITNISVEEDFFELGGDSLKAVSLILEIQKLLNVKPELDEIFRNSTPKQLATIIENYSEKSQYIPIPKVEPREYYPLSSAQRRMYALYLLDEKSTAYNLPSATLIEGKFDFKKLESAFKKLIKRHESLRTSFELVDSEVFQKINDKVDFSIEYKNLSNDKNNENIKKLTEELIKDFVKPYDLSKPPLLRVELVKLSENKHILLFDVHHIIADGTSAEILTGDLFKLYYEDLPEVKVQYKDFANWQNAMLNSDKIKEQKSYWLNKFSGELPILNLPLDFPRPPIKSFKGDRIYFTINENYTLNLKKIASDNGSTLYMVLLTLYNILLYKYTGQNDIIIGSPNAGRRHPDIENVVGMFVNTLPMRNFPDGEKTFKEFLLEVKENVLKAFENQDYQFDELVEQLNLERDISRNPLFETEFDLQNMEFYEMKAEGLNFTPLNVTMKTSQFDISLECEEHENKLYSFFEYCTDIFKKETIKTISKKFIKLISNVIENPEIKLKDISLLEEEDIDLVNKINNTTSEYDKDKTISDLFENTAKKYPDKIALIAKDRNLTYSQLNEEANKIANFLRKKGIKNGDIVGLISTRTSKMILGILGIIKSGAAYLPIDPVYPESRINYILTNSGVNILLTTEEININYNFKGEIVPIDDSNIKNESTKNPENINYSEDPLYLIYTSGSTGKPKGVVIKHKSVNNFIHGITKAIDFNDKKKIISLTTFSFDIFVLESLLPLTKGLTMVLTSDEAQQDPKEIGRLIKNYSINMIQTTPSRMKVLIEDEEFTEAVKELDTIMIGGESFPENLLEQLQLKTNAKIYNMYGPTETTVWSTIKDLTNSKNITIGKPISNTRIYILDDNNKIAPIGVYGELCIAGDGLAKGYFKNKKLTKQKFVEVDLFKRKEIVYKTGDLARVTLDGEIEIKGRIDSQVKIRGYRIELEEVEKNLLENKLIKEAIVVKKEDKKGNAFLCAYYIANKQIDEETFNKELRAYLSKKLPYYMIPSHFIKVEKWPLTPNQKIDKKSLPDPLNRKTIDKNKIIKPEDSFQKEILRIWQDVLGIDGIGINDNFFDIGGNSMLLIQVISKIRKLTNKDIPVVSMFQYPTIMSFANYLQSNTNQVKNIKRTKLSRLNETSDIAIIGMAGKFPGASSIDEYWKNLIMGKESIKFFSNEELRESGIDEYLLKNPDYIKAKGYLDNIEYFDADFFGYTPAEAELMDPQLRLLHECTWTALENAGYIPDNYEKSIGLFVGSSSNLLWLTRLLTLANNRIMSYNAGTLNEKDFVATRISFKLNLKGPSFTVQTACSTSLVTVHLACQSLLKGECDMALAGGVSLSLPRKEGYLYQEGMIFSKDGHCRPFDDDASGTVFGNGVGIVVLKRLDDAIRDNDNILAIIKGSAINNDGIRKIGFTAPSIDGQAEVISNSLELAGIHPESINYIETHGTGTNLGDPIEIEALKQAFSTNKRNFCAIGSVKANIGHLDTAAGIASLIKVVLSLKNRVFPALINFKKPNSKIDFIKSPFFINIKNLDFKKASTVLRAGVSSFGIGGTNCHIILEQAPERRI